MSASVMKLKSTWLKQVMQDNGLPPLAFKFAYALCEYINHETGVAWPSMPTLASDACISERSAWRFAESLKERGHLIVTPGGGRASTNRYQLSVKADAKPCKPVRVSSHINPATMSGFERINPDSACIKTMPLLADKPNQIQSGQFHLQEMAGRELKLSFLGVAGKSSGRAVASLSRCFFPPRTASFQRH